MNLDKTLQLSFKFFVKSYSISKLLSKVISIQTTFYRGTLNEVPSPSELLFLPCQGISPVAERSKASHPACLLSLATAIGPRNGFGLRHVRKLPVTACICWCCFCLVWGLPPMAERSKASHPACLLSLATVIGPRNGFDLRHVKKLPVTTGICRRFSQGTQVSPTVN